MFFVRHILPSTWNAKGIAQSPAIKTPSWQEEMAGLLVADAEKIISLSWSLNRLQMSLYQQTRGVTLAWMADERKRRKLASDKNSLIVVTNLIFSEVFYESYQ